MRKFLTICAIILSLSASAQWQLTGSKVRYVNGIGIPTRDTAAGVGADSSQILIRPADSSLYVKYKRTWMRVGGGGGSIAGSGTTNYIPKFTSSTAIGNSILVDNNNAVSIGNTASSWRSGANAIQFGTNRYGSLWQQSSGAVDLSFAAYENGTNTFAYTTTGDAPTLYQQVTGNHAWYNAPSGTAGNTITWNERMRITAAGDVGIGTTSPGEKLTVTGNGTFSGSLTSGGLLTTNNRLWISANNPISDWISSSLTAGYSATNSYGWLNSANNLVFGTDGSERMRITSDGNVGIGVVPSAASAKTLEIGNLGNTLTGFGGGDIALMSNAYFNNPNFVYAGSNLAASYRLQDGIHKWFIAPTGTAGNTITFTQAMTLDASGRLGIGTTSPGSRLDVSGTATATNLSVTTNATVGGTLRVTGTTTLGTTNTGAINASSVDAGTGNGSFGNVYSGGIVQMLGVNVKYRNISATYTATTSDDYFINITSGTFTLNLPTAATPYGQVYVIKNSGTGTITVDPNGSQTIDGATTFTMNVQNGSITIIGDGTNWKIVSKYL